MKKEEKKDIVKQLAAQLEASPNFYLADIAGLNAEKSALLRRECFEKDIELTVVKNTLLRIALEQLEIPESDKLYPILVGPTAIMFSESINAPAKLIKEFGKKAGKPVLKGAFVQEEAYVGEDQLETLVAMKSREELIGDIITLLQSPVKNVISGLEASGGGTIAGLVKTLSEKEE